MSTAHPSAQAGFGLRRMLRRNPAEEHRTATPLELLFDLVFVVAVSLASQGLHHSLLEEHFAQGVLIFVLTFFGVWWAWMNFTWFSTSYDTDDWLYRIATIVQMAGVLIFAAGIPAINNLEHPDFTVGVIGYAVMRVAMASQWFRAAASDPERRTTALRYGGGILVVQVLWISLLIVPQEFLIPVAIVGGICELLVPVFAERAGTTSWHLHHISERYGLFTIIVLGESILASTNAFVAAATERDHLGSLILLAATALVIVACFWWLYFSLPQQGLLTSFRAAIGWGYGHLPIFASAAALSVGIEIAIDLDSGESQLSAVAAAACLTIPCAIYVLMVWLNVIRRQETGVVNVIIPVAAVAIALTAFLPYSAQLTALLMVGVVALVTSRRPVSEPE